MSQELQRDTRLAVGLRIFIISVHESTDSRLAIPDVILIACRQILCPKTSGWENMW